MSAIVHWSVTKNGRPSVPACRSEFSVDPETVLTIDAAQVTCLGCRRTTAFIEGSRIDNTLAVDLAPLDLATRTPCPHGQDRPHGSTEAQDWCAGPMALLAEPWRAQIEAQMNAPLIRIPVEEYADRIRVKREVVTEPVLGALVDDEIERWRDADHIGFIPPPMTMADIRASGEPIGPHARALASIEALERALAALSNPHPGGQDETLLAIFGKMLSTIKASVIHHQQFIKAKETAQSLRDHPAPD